MGDENENENEGGPHNHRAKDDVAEDAMVEDVPNIGSKKKKPGEPMKSQEGWTLIVRNVHKEAQEDDVKDAFSEFGKIKAVHVNLDRTSGFAKGYSFVVFAEKEDADRACKEANGSSFLGATISVDFAFLSRPIGSDLPHWSTRKRRSFEESEPKPKRYRKDVLDEDDEEEEVESGADKSSGNGDGDDIDSRRRTNFVDDEDAGDGVEEEK